MNNRSTRSSPILRLVPLKWQRVFEHSRMIKYCRVVRRFKKTLFCLGKHGTLFCKKSVPFLCVATVTVSSLFYLLCLKFNLMDFFHALLEKVGFSLGGRALSFALKRVGLLLLSRACLDSRLCFTSAAHRRGLHPYDDPFRRGDIRRIKLRVSVGLASRTCIFRD